MTGRKRKKLLIGFGIAAGVLLMAAGVVYYQKHAEWNRYRYIRSKDTAHLRQCLIALRIYEMDERKFPETLLELIPDYVDHPRIFETPGYREFASQPYIYLAPFSKLPGNASSGTIILVSPIFYPRDQVLVGFSDGTTAFIHDSELPVLKNHSPAN